MGKKDLLVSLEGYKEDTAEEGLVEKETRGDVTETAILPFRKPDVMWTLRGPKGRQSQPIEIVSLPRS